MAWRWLSAPVSFPLGDAARARTHAAGEFCVCLRVMAEMGLASVGL
ncbi:MAG: hypothetical protein ACLRRN_04990 [Oscillospiraceae bacterium]